MGWIPVFRVQAWEQLEKLGATYVERKRSWPSLLPVLKRKDEFKNFSCSSFLNQYIQEN